MDGAPMTNRDAQSGSVSEEISPPRHTEASKRVLWALTFVLALGAAGLHTIVITESEPSLTLLYVMALTVTLLCGMASGLATAKSMEVEALDG